MPLHGESRFAIREPQTIHPPKRCFGDARRANV